MEKNAKYGKWIGSGYTPGKSRNGMGLEIRRRDITKLILTLFRLIAVVWGTFFIRKIIRRK